MKIESVSLCPICESKGWVFLRGCRDYLADIPGNWAFQKCFRCNSLWLDPRPTEESIRLLYPDNYLTHTQPFDLLKPKEGFVDQYKFAAKLAILEYVYGYNGLSKRINLLQKFIVAKFIRFLSGLSRRVGYTVRFLHFRPQGRLLDVGCGNGTFLQLMNQLGWEVVGIDSDPQATKLISSKGIEVFTSSLEEINLEPASYDAITLHHVLEHLPNPREMLNKLVASLKKGGVLVIITPNPDGLMAKCFGIHWRGLEPPRHFVLPSPKAYKLLFKNIGLKVKIWTMTYSEFWRCRESLSIKQTGKTNNYSGWLLPKLWSLVSSMAVPTFHFAGDEVVCIGIKN